MLKCVQLSFDDFFELNFFLLWMNKSRVCMRTPQCNLYIVHCQTAGKCISNVAGKAAFSGEYLQSKKPE